jgi:hypothetical protein
MQTTGSADRRYLVFDLLRHNNDDFKRIRSVERQETLALTARVGPLRQAKAASSPKQTQQKRLVRPAGSQKYLWARTAVFH